MKAQRLRAELRVLTHGRSVNPVVKRRANQRNKLARYGLTQDTFERLLEAQGYACAMCSEPFEEDQPIHIDHDHNLGCHPEEKRACNRCRRGLLCLPCNTALGVIERKYELAHAYLDRRLGRAPDAVQV